MSSIARHGAKSERYLAALAVAERRAQHSFFDQHNVGVKRLSYFAMDEGGYNALIAPLAARAGHTVLGAMPDEF